MRRRRFRLLGGPFGGRDIVVSNRVGHRKIIQLIKPKNELSYEDIDDADPVIEIEKHNYHFMRFSLSGREEIFYVHESIKGKKQDDHPEIVKQIKQSSPWPAERCISV